MNVLIKTTLLVSTLFLYNNSFAQAPPLQWQHNFGGNQADSSLQTVQNKYDDIYVSGFGYSTNQDLVGNAGSADIWLAKLDQDGNKIWGKRFGGSLRDRVIDITAAQDGGAVLLCYSESIDGDFTNTGNLTGVSVIKTDIAGNIVWHKYYQGTPKNDGAIIATSDGGYLFASSLTGSQLLGGVTVNSAGASDIWLVKINSTGTVSWHKTIGGTLDETPASLLQNGSDLYIIGSTSSTTVNGSNSNGNSDVILGKYNNSGLLSWTRLFGGTNDDFGKDITAKGSGLYCVAASKSSNGDVSFGNNGGFDSWVFDLDNQGSIGFNNFTFGSISDEIPSSINYDVFEDAPIISGTTYASGGPVVPNIFVTKYIFGSQDWQAIYGGSGVDLASDCILLSDGGFIITGQSTSSNGNLTGNFGLSDFWAFKIHDPCPDNLILLGEELGSNFSRSADLSIKSTVKLTGPSTYSFFDAKGITLEPGFEVKNGAVFCATPQGCN